MVNQRTCRVSSKKHFGHCVRESSARVNVGNTHANISPQKIGIYFQYPFTRSISDDCFKDIHDGKIYKESSQQSKFLSVPEHTGLILKNSDGASHLEILFGLFISL